MKKYWPLTVGIPVYNSGLRLPLFLPFLLHQTYPKRFIDLRFVDSQSTDETVKILQNFKQAYGSRYKSLEIDQINRVEEVEKGVRDNIALARNRIVETSPQDNDIFFIDDDVAPKPNALSKLIKFADKYHAAIAVGLYPLAQKHEKDGKERIEIAPALFKLVEGHLKPLGTYKSSGVTTFKIAGLRKEGFLEVDAAGTGFMFIKRHVLDKISFHTCHEPEAVAKTSDFVFCLEARKLGFKILADPNVWVDHFRINYDRTVSHGVVTLTFRSYSGL